MLERPNKAIDVIIPERLRQRHWDGYRQTMKTGESRYGAGDVLAVPALRKDGVTISVEFTAVPLRNEADQMSMVAIIQDVTKRFAEMQAFKRKLTDATRMSGKQARPSSRRAPLFKIVCDLGPLYR